MSRLFGTTVAAVIGCFGMSVCTVQAASLHTPVRQPTVTRVAPIAAPAQAAPRRLANDLLELINVDRQRFRLAPVRAARPLAQVALLHSLDMAKNDYVSHFTLRGTSPASRIEVAGIQFQMAGENLGMDAGYSDEKMLQRIDVAMLNSPEHRANLLRPGFGRVGIGIALAGNRLFVTEDFMN